MPASGAAVAAGAIGVGLLWSALENKSFLSTVKDVVSGKKPVGTPVASNVVNTVVNPSAGIPGVTQGIPAGIAASGTPASNKSLGLLMAAAYGWAGSGEWPYLLAGWNEESGWNQYAANVESDPYNHAYGIPQANPGTKMATAGSDWKTSPVTQIKWGLGYIKETYGSPSRVPGWTPGGPSAGYVGY
jgi:hypothetical protein